MVRNLTKLRRTFPLKYRNTRSSRELTFKVRHSTIALVVSIILYCFSTLRSRYNNGLTIILQHPRAVRWNFGSINCSRLDLSTIHIERIDLDDRMLPPRRHLTNPLFIVSKEVHKEEDDLCRPLPWQIESFSTCNTIHELGIGNRSSSPSGATQIMQRAFVYMNSGHNRDVWMVGSRSGEYVALKTLVMENKIDASSIDHQKRDAIISEHCSFSDHIVNIFSYCGTSALNELASGTLEEVYPTMNKDERLHAAVDVAKALADLHSLGHVVHADIAVRQFLKIGGRYKLNDFNTSGMMHRRVQSGDICPFQIHKAGDKNRAPEEMISPYLVTEAIDVYSMGNIFWKLLTNERKYDNLSTAKAQRNIIMGKEPTLPNAILMSSHATDVALRKSIKMCLQRLIENRKSASEISMFLSRALEQVIHKNGVTGATG